MRGCQPSASSLCSVAEVAMCVTSALEPRCFRHSLMSDSSCPINSFPCAKNIFIGICSPFPTGDRPDRPSEWLSAEVAILGLALVQDATSSISVRSSSGAHEPFTRFPSQAAMFLFLLHGRRHRRVLNHCHRTLGIAVIVRAFFNDTITVAVWTGFHVCTLWGCYHTADIVLLALC
jgi:hypothetical protein